jgi:hypothetical protein
MPHVRELQCSNAEITARKPGDTGLKSCFSRVEAFFLEKQEASLFIIGSVTSGIR